MLLFDLKNILNTALESNEILYDIISDKNAI